jgi:hypothetical protein
LKTWKFNNGFTRVRDDLYEEWQTDLAMSVARLARVELQLSTATQRLADLPAVCARQSDRRLLAQLQREQAQLRKKNTELTSAVTVLTNKVRVQGDVRIVRQAFVAVPHHKTSLAHVLADVDATNTAFAAQWALNSVEDRFMRQSEVDRKTKGMHQAVANTIYNFARKAQLTKGPIISSRPPFILIGDAGDGPPDMSVQRVLDLLSLDCLVSQEASEFRTTATDPICGGIAHKPPLARARPGRKARLLRGTVQCSNPNCPSEGRFQNRDLMAACNIALLWVYSMLLGGYLGGYSRCEALTADKTRLVDSTQRLSLFSLFH